MDGEGPRIGINGFGRIGRLVVRALLQGDKPVDLVGVNDLTPNHTLAHLFRHDSVHGAFPGHVEATDDGLVIDGDRLRVFEEADPAALPWGDLGVDIVIEASGRFRRGADMQKHIDAGAPRVLLTAPGKEVDLTVVMGVNDHEYDRERHHLVSNASCTTNCLAPVLKVLDDHYGVLGGFMTTIHAVTGDQNLVDGPHKDLRRARAALNNMIPTTTGAAKAIGLVMPHLAGKIDGLAVRVPTLDVSLVDLNCRLERPPDMDGLVDMFHDEAAGRMEGILGCADEPLTSIDFTGDARSSIVDMPSLMIHGDMVKVLSWYDNEYGYASRVADMALKMTK